MMEITIQKLGTASVLGYFTSLYLKAGNYIPFDEFMSIFEGATIVADYTSTGNDKLDNETVQDNKAFCDKYGMHFHCS